MNNRSHLNVPVDIQEKLAWGISNYNQQAIEEALDAGANPFTCHTTAVAQPHLVKNRIEALQGTQELSPYYLLFYNAKLAELSSQEATQAILHTAELLLKRNISVDTQPTNVLHGFGDTFTFRQQLQQWIKEFESELTHQKDNLTHEQQAIARHQLTVYQQLLTLIQKYQSV